MQTILRLTILPSFALPPVIVTAVVQLYNCSRCSFKGIGRIAADELRRMNVAEPMRLTNANKCA